MRGGDLHVRRFGVSRLAGGRWEWVSSDFWL